MHKETVNTFTKGMIKDTHPLTTPADVLTDCLNGTIITYNGNEMILLNDMGNVLIGTSTLPEGYIPIGVTEYGGIVYIASYNPTTGKGLIGSFPSPQLQHMSEMWSVNISELTPTTNELDLGAEFYDTTNVNDIVRTEYKYYLGRNGAGKDVYILHTGDKIKIENTGLADLQRLSCILLLFAILKKDGSIELVDGDYLDGAEHIYTGKSSGYPLIIIKMLTLKSFNLERKYSRGNTQNTINVEFTGKPLKEDPTTIVTLLTKTTTDAALPANYTDNNLTFKIENLPMSGSLKYRIVPKLNPQGNLVSMTKEGAIDLSKFKSDKAELKNWSYIIMDTYMKINWSFDYYNLDDDKEIRKVTFKFIPIDLPGSLGIPIDLEKDSFNGSFEEVVNFEEGITRNNIYVVKVIGYKGVDINSIDTEHPVHLGSRMVYTSGILNQYYGKVKDFTNTGFINDYPSVMWNYTGISEPEAHEMALKKTIEVKITPTINVTKTTTGNNIMVLDPKGNSINTNLREINAKTFTTKTTDIGNGYYAIDVTNTYHFEVGLKAEVKYDNQIVGSVADNTIKTMLASFVGNKLTFTDESQLIGTLRLNNEFTSPLEVYDIASTYEPGEGYTGTLKFSEDLILTSKMKVKATGVKTKVVERCGLRPLYYPSMDKAMKDKCFTAWNKDYPLFCAGADEEDYHYNVTLAGGSNSGGSSTGAGCDDTGLNTAMTLMGYPMVSMAAGMSGDEASYSPDETSADSAVEASDVLCYYRRRPVAGWSCSSNEIDGGDNFLMAVWKQTDNKYRFSVLGSLKAYLNNRNGRLVRLDYMLRCLLSQIFTKQAYKETLSYVTTNASEYAYYNTQIKVDVDLESNPSMNYNDVTYRDSLRTNYDILLGEYTIEKLLDSFKTGEGAITDNEVMIIKYDYQKTILGTDTTFATDFGIDDISTMFSGAAYEVSGDENDDKSNERWIYTVDWTAVDNYGRNKVYEFLSDDSINWKIDDLTPFLKLSGTKDGSGYAFVDDDGSYKVKKSNGTIVDIDDPLSLGTNSPSYIKANVVTVYNNLDYTKGGLTFSSHCYGDVLRTWNNKEWPFYHSFQHVFKTYCQWKDESISSEIYNEIVINRDSGHIGEQNVKAMWRNNKDENAPDMVGALGNSYNSIYAATTFYGTVPFPLENANYTV